MNLRPDDKDKQLHNFNFKFKPSTSIDRLVEKLFQSPSTNFDEKQFLNSLEDKERTPFKWDMFKRRIKNNTKVLSPK